MTVVAYNKGILAADTRALHDNVSGSSTAAIKVQKLKSLGFGTFAVAVSGSVPSEQGWKEIEVCFFRSLIQMEILTPCNTLFLDKKDLKLINSLSRNFIVMTHEHVYYMCFSNEEKNLSNGLTRLNKDDKIAFGSGSHCAYIAMDAGKNAIDAVKFTATVESTVGGPFDYVDQKELRQFIGNESKEGLIIKRMKERMKEIIKGKST